MQDRRGLSVQVDEHAQDLSRHVAQLILSQATSRNAGGERLAFDQLRREIKPQAHAGSVGEALDETRNCRVAQRLQGRRFTVEGVDLRSARNVRELQFLERNLLAARSARRVDASMRPLRDHPERLEPPRSKRDPAKRAAIAAARPSATDTHRLVQSLPALDAESRRVTASAGTEIAPET